MIVKDRAAEAVDLEIEQIKRALAARGMHLKFGRDFDFYCEQVDRQTGRSKVMEQFSPDGDMDGAVDAVWICGFDADGELLHTQAMQLHELGEASVADHIRRALPRYMVHSPSVIPASITALPGPKISRLRGRVVYHGEMWVAPHLRDMAVASLVNRLGMYWSMKSWDPDSVFGLMSWVLAAQGFGSRIGYMHSEAMTLRWKRSDGNNQHQVWAVFMEREDLDFLLNLPAVEFSTALLNNFKD